MAHATVHWIEINATLPIGLKPIACSSIAKLQSRQWKVLIMQLVMLKHLSKITTYYFTDRKDNLNYFKFKEFNWISTRQYINHLLFYCDPPNVPYMRTAQYAAQFIIYRYGNEISFRGSSAIKSSLLFVWREKFFNALIIFLVSVFNTDSPF